MAQKPGMSLAFVGTRSSGKTLGLAQLCRYGNGFAEESLEACRGLAKELGNPDGGGAWMLDKLVAERELGISMESSLASFESNSFRFSAIDTPGDRLNKGVLSAASLADVAVLVVSAADGEYEAGMKTGDLKEIGLACFTMGIKSIVVLVTKMDDPSVHYSMSRFDEIKTAVNGFLKDVGYKQKEIPFVPITGTAGDNINVKSDRTPWYGGETAMQILDTQGPINRPPEKPLRVPVLKVLEVPGSGTVVVGRVETGSIRSGLKVTFSPGGFTAEVQSVHVGGEEVSEAKGGDIASLSIGDAMGDVSRGMVVGSSSSDPPADVESFIAQIIILDHPGLIRAGYCPAIALGTHQVPCEFEELLAKIDRKTGKDVEQNPESAKSNEVIRAKLRPKQPVCAETFAMYGALGRFAVRDHRRTVALGVIKEVTKRSIPKPRSRDGGENRYFDD